MIKHINNNRFLFGILLSWLIIGSVSTYVAIGFVLIVVVLFVNEALMLEIFFGFIFILALSDNYTSLGFAKAIKPVYMLLFLAPILFHSNSFSPLNHMIKPFAVFFAIATLCLPFSLNLSLGVQKTLSYVLIIFVTSNYVTYFLKAQKIRFLLTLVYFGAFFLSLGLILKVVNPGFVHMGGRYKGLLGNPNGIGVFSFLYLFTFTIIKHYYPKLFSKRDNIIIYFIIFASLLLCQSRGAFSVILIFAFGVLIQGKNKPLIIILGLLGAVIYIGIIQNLETIISAFGLENYLRVSTLETGSGRLIAFDFAWSQIKEHMFYGGGINYTNDVFSLNKEELHDMGHQGKAHNTLLTMWLDTGIFGLLAFIYGWGIAFAKAQKLSKFALPLAAGIIFGINIESWLASSLNPFTIQLIIILSLLSDNNFINGEET